MKVIDLKELEEVFNERFEKVYSEFNRNIPEVKQMLINSDSKFLEKYFFNNGIKEILTILRENQDKENG